VSRVRTALVFRGSPDDRLDPRLEPMAKALAAAGLDVVSVPFDDRAADVAARRLEGADGVLVWVDPLSDDGDRGRLDAVLRDAEAAGAWVSAHPDVIDRIGTKEVLVTSRDLGWGSDTHLYLDPDQFRREFPARLAADRVRVLKASRGNGGRTVWKVRLPTATPEHARLRDGTTTSVSLAGLMTSTATVFEAWGRTGRLIDQEFVPGITRGILRCYLVGGTVVGFARQYPEGAVPTTPLDVVAGTGGSPDAVMGLPSPKTMYPPVEPAFADLRLRLESDWVPGLCRATGVSHADLPALWDVDLLLADAPPDAAPRYVLCEVNASSVIPFPPEAPRSLAEHVVSALPDR
jgi:hypothetical protein